MVTKANNVYNKIVRRNKTLFSLINIVLSTVFMVAAYWLWLKDLEKNFTQLLLIILASIITGWIGSWVARLMTMHFKSLVKPFNYYLRALFQSVFYGLLIWIGLITLIFETMEFWEICLVLLLVKAFIFFASDYASDKVSFGG